MKYTSPVYSAASGSIAGVTYSRNRGGSYTRQRAVPTNPNSTAQQLVRGYMSNYSSNWRNLTAVQQNAWQDYADATPLVDSLGQQHFVTGQNMYVRTNVFRASAGLSAVTSAPIDSGLAEMSNPTSITITGTTNILTATISGTDAWASASTGAMIIRASRPLSPGVNSSKHNLRLAGVVMGNTTTPPTATGNITIPFLVSAAQKCAVAFRVCDGQGRLSPIYQQLITVG